jgi:site-specific recombinase XerD
VSKALALRVGDIELGPRSGKLLVREGKGLKSRMLALSSETRDSLKTYLQVPPKSAGDLLFLSRTYHALDPGDVQRMVSEAARRAGIKFAVTPHTWRHSFATRFLAKNHGDIATLASILGHANISTTTRYLHPNAQRVQEMVEEM